MRIRVAFDRVVRSLLKSFNPSTHRARRSGSGARTADQSVGSPAPTRPLDYVIFVSAFVFFVHSIYSVVCTATFRPDVHWHRRRASTGSVQAVVACNNMTKLEATLASVSALNVPTSVALPIQMKGTSVDATFVDGVWYHTAAQNLAAALAPADWLLVLPCGCDAPATLPETLADDSFYLQIPHATIHTCAHTMIVRKRHYFDVRGADERAASLADPSLRERLVLNGIQPRRTMFVARKAQFDVLATVQLTIDAALQRGVPPWVGGDELFYGNDAFETVRNLRSSNRARLASRASAYIQVQRGVYRMIVFPCSLPMLYRGAIFATGDAVRRARSLSVRQLLNAQYAIPFSLSSGMKDEEAWRLLTLLASMQRDRGVVPRVMAVQPMHGLGNRIRAIASAAAYAHSTSRVLVVVWTRDAHCLARWEALFSHSDEVFVTTSSIWWPRGSANTRADPSWARWSAFDYMREEEKDEPVGVPPDEHVLFRSAYTLRALHRREATWAAANTEMRALIPSEEVVRIIASKSIGDGVFIGVHVRARAVAGEIAGASYGTNATAVLEYWRSKSAPSTFIREMQRTDASRFVVTADCDQARAALRRLGSHVIVLDGCDDRSEHCVQVAFAEMLLLSRGKQLLASPWSSYSEVVSRYGGIRMRIAGIDFNVDSVEDVSAMHGDDVAHVLREVLKRRKGYKRVASTKT